MTLNMTLWFRGYEIQPTDSYFIWYGETDIGSVAVMPDVENDFWQVYLWVCPDDDGIVLAQIPINDRPQEVLEKGEHQVQLLATHLGKLASQ